MAKINKPKPKFKSGQVVRYDGYMADIVKAFWDEWDSWRYSIEIRRGPMRGNWTVREDKLVEEK